MTTRTTFHLSLSGWAMAAARVRAWLFQRDPIAVAGVLAAAIVALLALVAIVATTLRGVPPAATAQPTPQLPIIMIATAQAQHIPTAAATKAAEIGPTLQRAVVAYDSPNGSVIGAIDSGRAYTVLERAGADWLHADVSGSGVVWLRTAEVFDLPSNLADVQPTVAPEVVYVTAPSAPQTAPAYRTDTQPSQPAVAPTGGGPIVLSDAERSQALAEHNARQLAWCGDQQTAYCAMVRGAVQP